MFSYDPATGIAYSDAADDEQWAFEIGKGKEWWLEQWARKIIPDHVFVKVNRTATHYVITKWLRQNGYRLVENDRTMHWAIMHGDDVVTQFKVALQSPELGHCRFCGQPLTLGSKTDVHPICTVKEHLEATILSRKRVVKA